VSALKSSDFESTQVLELEFYLVFFPPVWSFQMQMARAGGIWGWSAEQIVLTCSPQRPADTPPDRPVWEDDVIP
jgi:hypothetical protein